MTSRAPHSTSTSLTAIVLALAAASALACGRPAAQQPPPCPPCECLCANAGGAGGASGASGASGAGPQSPANGASPATPPAAGGSSMTPQQRLEVDELMASANRKMNFDDGAGCLADLDRLVALEPRYERSMLLTRAQCEMLVGRCQQGKERIARYFREEQNMHPERALTTAESMASMRCRGGDSSDRDRLLGALFQLQQGAYMNPIGVDKCREHLNTARALAPKVQPQGPDDHQIRSAPTVLFHLGANCYARAGECGAARRAFTELFPPENLASVQDPAMRERIVAQAFESSVERCKGKP